MNGLHHVSLPDGRSLDARITGPATGTPLVFHHGTPGAATPVRAIERAAHERGLRLITFSRPGYGDSDRQQGRVVADVAADTAAVLRTVGADRCLVAGWSGGGPYALACAARLDAAQAVAVIASIAPFDATDLDWMASWGYGEELRAATRGEKQLRPYLDGMREQLKNISLADIVPSLEAVLPDVDKSVVTGELGDDMIAAYHEALRTGVDGWLDDDLAMTRPWGFDLEEISRPIMLWQGSEDRMVPFSHGRWLASNLPGVSDHVEEGQGHLRSLLAPSIGCWTSS